MSDFKVGDRVVRIKGSEQGACGTVVRILKDPRWDQLVVRWDNVDVPVKHNWISFIHDNFWALLHDDVIDYDFD